MFYIFLVCNFCNDLYLVYGLTAVAKKKMFFRSILLGLFYAKAVLKEFAKFSGT